jgi:biotin transport system substrate-specific component
MTTLAARYLPAENAMLRNILLAVAGSLFVAGAAQVSVPMWPVPMTLQTLAVLLVGGAYGARLGAATIGLYALEGAAGLPFFAKGNAGLAYLLHGTTTGYVIGFILAAGLIGLAAQSGAIKSPVRMVAAGLLASALVYVPGVLWLAAWFVNNKAAGFSDALMMALGGGFVPFIIGDIVKAAIAGLGLSATWNAKQG